MGTLKFTKMHGCGNDYVYFDCFSQNIEDPETLSIRLSDRHKGVGGDGIIMVCPSDIADGRMRIFNADGSEAMMCGNGIRCVAKFLYDTGLAHKKHLEIDTLSGVKYCDIIEKNGEAVAVTVDMGRAELVPGRIPVSLPGERIVGETVSVAGGEYEVTCVSMGNPHCVLFGGDPMELDLETVGPRFEKDPIFPQGVNTEFIEVIDSHTLKMRVWERGSGETMACGTGACAAAVAACLNGYCKMGEDITVHLRGGDLVINYTDERVRMTGEAVKVFDGEIEV
ncbi:diaminopimelate epimerase [Acutalibacter muris]|uniref:Diaminopimelate epimerase n=1 Tax=Acutalibacter muris TaxID=1796620 RepID=A0A1Z2XSX5_9FIRM|nr:diaminopimelate epimerase [Acutalibacter muris]ANU55234.1 diaminopimelate epimerase [Hungateiclostridiaceae bacterium KB18]ASB41530.1 diaminopimelate epimerase [Acutalibacter muris]QQR30789.1 diaminopimelate epimerase [Acutalibacter muris]